MIEIDPPDAESRRLWRAVGKLAALLPEDWTLVGGLMVQLHALEHDITDVRYHGGNLDRLRRVKALYDPDGLLGPLSDRVPARAGARLRRVGAASRRAARVRASAPLRSSESPQRTRPSGVGRLCRKLTHNWQRVGVGGNGMKTTGLGGVGGHWLTPSLDERN
jgi:Berberine and berberine like